MKIYLSILACLLCACYNTEEKIPENILSETAFEDILKEIHLAEGAFELNKVKNMGNAQSTLESSYISIYSEYKISAIEFKTTLNYYAQHPEKLENIYSNVLEKLTEERSTLNQQGTN